MIRVPRSSFVVLLLLGMACKGKPAEPTKEANGKATTEDAAGSEAKAETKPSREELVRGALERVPTITKGVAEIRGLELKQDVAAEGQSQADFRKFVEAEIDKELPPEKAKNISRALFAMGLLKEPIELATVLEDALVSQAGAYYDPVQKKFMIVMVPENQIALDTISAHELDHALQDQHFDLGTYLSGRPKGEEGASVLTEDQINARRYIVEGEATLVMMVYTGKAMTNMNLLAKDSVAALRPQLQMLANMDSDALIEMTKAQASSYADMGEDFQAAIEAMDKIPPYVLVPLLGAYMEGAMPVYEAFLAGGWDAVNAMYTNPPESTEQVLHPVEKLIGKRDRPVLVDIQAPEGFALLHSDVLGELGWRTFFQLWSIADGKKAAAGWDGDRYAVYEKDGAVVYFIATAWDSPEDAEEFETAYLAALAARHPAADHALMNARVGNKVWIVGGSTDPALIAQLRRAKFSNPK